jgi:hypothetical protein
MSNLLDGDMEAVDASAWLVPAHGAATKNTSYKHSGLRSLMVAGNSPISNPYTYQACLVIGYEYRVRGWATILGTGGNGYAEVWNGDTKLWQGTHQYEFAWESFDVTFTATSEELRLYCYGSSDHSVLFDDLICDGGPAPAVGPKMKAVFEALLPPGAIWRPREGGDFDHLLDGMGDGAQTVYEFIDAIARTRDPRETTILSDLEKEYGITPNSELTEAVRRVALAAIKYAIPTPASWEHLQTFLRASGFDDIVVTPNDPAIDPSLIDGELLVNGPVYSRQSPAYLMECAGDFACCGNGKAVCGYFVNIGRILFEYSIPALSPYWRFFFFVGGAASGWPESPAIEQYVIPEGRTEELKRLILRYKPLRSWCVMNAEFIA